MKPKWEGRGTLITSVSVNQVTCKKKDAGLRESFLPVIKRAVNAYGIEQIAEELGVCKRTVWNWLYGRTLPLSWVHQMMVLYLATASINQAFADGAFLQAGKGVL